MAKEKGKTIQGLSKRIIFLLNQKTAGNVRRFAVESGVKRTTLDNLLAGDPDASGSNLLKIAQYGGVSMNWLLTGEEPVGKHAHSSTKEEKVPYIVSGQLSEAEQRFIEAGKLLAFDALSKEERELLKLFRAIDEQGKIEYILYGRAKNKRQSSVKAEEKRLLGTDKRA